MTQLTTVSDIFRFKLTAAGILSVLLLAAPNYGQTVPIADASTTGSEPAMATKLGEDAAVRPFHINVPEEQLVELRQRIAATRWPDKETVRDESQGIRLAEMQALVHYWGNG